MRILFIGAAHSIHTVRWVNALSERHDVFLAYCSNHSENTNKINDKVKHLPLRFSSPFGYYFNARQLRRLVKKYDIDVVNVHYASGYGTLARKSKIKDYILSVWGSDVYEFPYTSKSNKKRLIKNLNAASFLASTSYSMAEQAREFLTDKTRKIAITPFGVDTFSFRPLNDLKDSNYLTIGTVKTLEPLYGITQSIQAFNKVYLELLKTNKNVADKLRYEIYGKGPQEYEILALIKSLGLNDKVFLKGFVEHSKLPEVFNRFDIGLYLSLRESFGVAAIETMACGVPVVTSDASGFKEVVKANETGIVVEKENVDAAAEALLIMLNNESLKSCYSINARKHVEKLYNWKDNVASMEELYLDASSVKGMMLK